MKSSFTHVHANAGIAAIHSFDDFRSDVASCLRKAENPAYSDSPSQTKAITFNAATKRGKRKGQMQQIKNAKTISNAQPFRFCPTRNCPAPGAMVDKKTGKRSRLPRADDCTGVAPTKLGSSSVKIVDP